MLVIMAFGPMVSNALAGERLIPRKDSCRMAGGEWNASNESCSHPETYETYPDCSGVEAPGPSWLWCPFPIALIGGIAMVLAIVGVVLQVLGFGSDEAGGGGE